MTKKYTDRSDAGRQLACHLEVYKDNPDVLVLGLPRGGVVVGYEVAAALNVAFDVYIVRKLGTPGQPELAMGAIAEDGKVLLNDSVVRYMSISREMVEQTAEKELVELKRRKKLYRGDRPQLQLADKIVLLVDDGLATGSTMKVAVQAIKRQAVKKCVVAVPVGAESTCLEIGQEVDEIVCPFTPEPLMAVGVWFDDFEQTTDAEVHDLLK